MSEELELTKTCPHCDGKGTEWHVNGGPHGIGRMGKCHVCKGEGKVSEPKWRWYQLLYPQGNPPAESADLIAEIRSRVESGTISGMEVVCDWCDGEGTNGFDRNGSHAAGEYREFTCTQCDGSGRILIIPVSGSKEGDE